MDYIMKIINFIQANFISLIIIAIGIGAVIKLTHWLIKLAFIGLIVIFLIKMFI